MSKSLFKIVTLLSLFLADLSLALAQYESRYSTDDYPGSGVGAALIIVVVFLILLFFGRGDFIKALWKSTSWLFTSVGLLVGGGLVGKEFAGPLGALIGSMVGLGIGLWWIKRKSFSDPISSSDSEPTRSEVKGSEYNSEILAFQRVVKERRRVHKIVKFCVKAVHGGYWFGPFFTVTILLPYLLRWMDVIDIVAWGALGFFFLLLPFKWLVNSTLIEIIRSHLSPSEFSEIQPLSETEVTKVNEFLDVYISDTHKIDKAVQEVKQGRHSSKV